MLRGSTPCYAVLTYTVLHCATPLLAKQFYAKCYCTTSCYADLSYVDLRLVLRYSTSCYVFLGYAVLRLVLRCSAPCYAVLGYAVLRLVLHCSTASATMFYAVLSYVDCQMLRCSTSCSALRSYATVLRRVLRYLSLRCITLIVQRTVILRSRPRLCTVL